MAGKKDRSAVAEVTGSGPAWLQKAEQELEALARLPENWNSYGARRVDPGLIRVAETLLRKISRPGIPLPRVVPTARGGVQLEWAAGGVALEIEINSPDSYQVLYCNEAEGKEEELEFGEEDLPRLVTLLSTLPATG